MQVRPKKLRLGYDVELELQNTLIAREKGITGTYQVFSEGREIRSLGSSEWVVNNN